MLTCASLQAFVGFSHLDYWDCQQESLLCGLCVDVTDIVWQCSAGLGSTIDHMFMQGNAMHGWLFQILLAYPTLSRLCPYELTLYDGNCRLRVSRLWQTMLLSWGVCLMVMVCGTLTGYFRQMLWSWTHQQSKAFLPNCWMWCMQLLPAVLLDSTKPTMHSMNLMYICSRCLSGQLASFAWLASFVS